LIDSRRGDYQYDQGDHSKPRLSLLGQAKMWPTPHSNCHTGAGTQGRDGGENLQTAVTMYPTPVAEEGRNRHKPDGKRGYGLETLIGGILNPTWVEWLMNFPQGWTEVD
jgi:hypothetical protein